MPRAITQRAGSLSALAGAAALTLALFLVPQLDVVARPLSLLSTVVHELGHGLGFSTTTSGPVRSVGAGSTHSCATGANGVQCWGEGRQGQLGDGTAVAREAPGPVPRS